MTQMKEEVFRRVVEVAREMLEDRGETNVRVHAYSPDATSADPAEKTLVLTSDRTNVHIFPSSSKIGVGFVRNILKKEDREQDDAKRFIVVSPSGATPFTKKEFAGSNVQFLTSEFLRVNVTKHALVPSFTVRDTKASEAEMKTLPKMLLSDPQAIYHAWEVGTVVRFRRRFGGSSPINYERVIVQG